MEKDYLKFFINLRDKRYSERVGINVALKRSMQRSAVLPFLPQSDAVSILSVIGSCQSKQGMSAEGCARISAAAKARWAKIRGEKTTDAATTRKKKKRRINASSKAAIAQAKRQWWAERRKQAATRL